MLRTDQNIKSWRNADIRKARSNCGFERRLFFREKCFLTFSRRSISHPIETFDLAFRRYIGSTRTFYKLICLFQHCLYTEQLWFIALYVKNTYLPLVFELSPFHYYLHNQLRCLLEPKTCNWWMDVKVLSHSHGSFETRKSYCYQFYLPLYNK